MSKKTIAVLFGGQSSEHEVSLVSATTIIANINKDSYDVIMIGITKDGRWLKIDNVEDLKSGQWINSKYTAIISPDSSHKGLLILSEKSYEIKNIDVVFPVLHGKNGEDGTVQGLFELAGIPYVGCGVLASSVSMDKISTKIIVESLGIRQAKYVAITGYDEKDIMDYVSRIEEKLNYPVFVKPSNAGSSRGVSKAHNKEELITALKFAKEHDRRILVEETIVGREVECAVLGGSNPKASRVGEIIAAAEFYDYDAKYNNDDSKTIITPDFPEGIEDKIRDNAMEIFKAVGGYGLSRVDFFLEKETNQIVFNETNTLPGFTSISMYPMLWESMGLGKPQLVEKLIQFAFVRDKD